MAALCTSPMGGSIVTRPCHRPARVFISSKDFFASDSCGVEVAAFATPLCASDICELEFDLAMSLALAFCESDAAKAMTETNNRTTESIRVRYFKWDFMFHSPGFVSG